MEYCFTGCIEKNSHKTVVHVNKLGGNVGGGIGIDKADFSELP